MAHRDRRGRVCLRVIILGRRLHSAATHGARRLRSRRLRAQRVDPGRGGARDPARVGRRTMRCRGDAVDQGIFVSHARSRATTPARPCPRSRDLWPSPPAREGQRAPGDLRGGGHVRAEPPCSCRRAICASAGVEGRSLRWTRDCSPVVERRRWFMSRGSPALGDAFPEQPARSSWRGSAWRR